jgi:large subunit ribosomal protein L23
MLKILNVIKYPLFTSKASSLNKCKKPKLVIAVSISSNKRDIYAAVESIFGAKIDFVNTVIVKGKNKIYGRRYKYKSSDYKKAIVTLKGGSEKIDELASGIDGPQDSASVDSKDFSGVE